MVESHPTALESLSAPYTEEWRRLLHSYRGTPSDGHLRMAMHLITGRERSVNGHIHAQDTMPLRSLSSYFDPDRTAEVYSISANARIYAQIMTRMAFHKMDYGKDTGKPGWLTGPLTEKERRKSLELYRVLEAKLTDYGGMLSMIRAPVPDLDARPRIGFADIRRIVAPLVDRMRGVKDAFR